MAEFFQNIVNWLASLDWPVILRFVLFFLASAVIIVLIITFLLARKRDDEYFKAMTYEASNIRVYKIDNTLDVVTYFNLGAMSEKRTCSIQEFYDSFPGHEPNRIKSWVKDVLEGKQTTDYLQTTVFFKRSTKKFPAFLRVAKVDPAKGIAHLESYILLDKKNGRSASGPSLLLSSERDFVDYLKANGTSNGMTFCFAIRPKDYGFAENNKEQKLSRSFLLRYRLALEPYVKAPAKLLGGGEAEYIIANYDMNDNTEAISFALKVVNSVTSSLKANRKPHDHLFEIKVGVVANKELLGDGTAILLASRKCAANAFELPSSIYFYKQGIDDFAETSESGNYRSEVERIIYEKKILYTYRPIYSIGRRRVYGFIGRAEPTADCAFYNMEELKNYALRAKDEKNLFAAIAKNLVGTYIAERELKSQKLFYPALMNELESIPAFFKRLRNAKEANLVFTLKESDVNNAVGSMGLEEVKRLFNEIHENDYDIAFVLSGKALLIDQELLAMGDSFIVDFSSHGSERNMDATIRSQLHALVERLIKFKKPIIASDLKNWDSIELVVSSGIDYISCNIFAPFSREIVEVNEKHATRVLDMKGFNTNVKGK
ncbi:MAG: hypothetical protein K6F36_01035 [Bacilli bacterium]|nr:hypothetical protein [Bacilli bacterium]